MRKKTYKKFRKAHKSISKKTKSKRGGTKVKVEAFNTKRPILMKSQSGPTNARKFKWFGREKKTGDLPKVEVKLSNSVESNYKPTYKSSYNEDDIIEKDFVEKDFDLLMEKIRKNKKANKMGGSDLPKGFDEEFNKLREKYWQQKEKNRQQEKKKLDELFKNDEKLEEDEYTKEKIDKFNKHG